MRRGEQSMVDGLLQQAERIGKGEGKRVEGGVVVAAVLHFSQTRERVRRAMTRLCSREEGGATCCRLSKQTCLSMSFVHRSE